MTGQSHIGKHASSRRTSVTTRRELKLADQDARLNARIPATDPMNTQVAVSALVAGAIALLVTGFSAHAGVSSRIAACRAETDSLKRLICYDAIPVDETAGANFSATSGPIAIFEGTGTTTTRPFEASGPVVVQVETESFLALEVKSPTAQFGTAHLSTDGSRPAELYVSERRQVSVGRDGTGTLESDYH